MAPVRGTVTRVFGGLMTSVIVMVVIVVAAVGTSVVLAMIITNSARGSGRTVAMFLENVGGDAWTGSIISEIGDDGIAGRKSMIALAAVVARLAGEVFTIGMGPRGELGVGGSRGMRVSRRRRRGRRRESGIGKMMETVGGISRAVLIEELIVFEIHLNDFENCFLQIFEGAWGADGFGMHLFLAEGFPDFGLVDEGVTEVDGMKLIPVEIVNVMSRHGSKVGRNHGFLALFDQVLQRGEKGVRANGNAVFELVDLGNEGRRVVHAGIGFVASENGRPESRWGGKGTPGRSRRRGNRRKQIL